MSWGFGPKTHTTVPEGILHIPKFYPVLKTLDQVVDVDYYMPGCPPESHQIANVIDLVLAVLAGESELPPKGSVIGAGDSTCCDECPRQRNIKKITKFVRSMKSPRSYPLISCLLEQGILCNGMATRSGCGALCPQYNAPCIGCYGPAEGVIDVGARSCRDRSSDRQPRSQTKSKRILDGIPDPAGSFYRFGLAHSLLHAGKSAMPV